VKIQLIASASFRHDLRELKKDYPHVNDDLNVLFVELRQGETPGDRISGVGYTVFKVRVKSSDIRRGKRGGYRVIYYLKTIACIYMVAVYIKSQQENIDKKVLKRLITDILGDTDLPC
jgi:mRNA-degrading endonuclease RelE of RelBE toxin-antitoxin system